MSEAFREPTPEEIRLATLQFMGQNLGDLKALDKHIVSKNPTLQGLSLNAEGILKTIPLQENQSQPQPQRVPTLHAQPPMQQAQPPIITRIPITPESSDKIALSLDRIAVCLEKIQEITKDTLTILSKTSK